MDTDAPLEGVRVVEFATAVSGPWAAALLARHGAHVTKVESLDGDMTRALGPTLNGHSLYFVNFNLGKDSVVVDLRSPTGREFALELCSNADIVIENWRSGVAERLGLTYDDVRARNPTVIYASIRGFPEGHSREGERVYDAVMQAASSMAATQGSDGVPEMIRTILPDKLTALATVQAILTSLIARSNGKGGRHLRISMLSSSISFLWPEMMRHLSTVERPDGYESFDPARRTSMLLQTSDGRWVMLSAITDSHWHAFEETTGITGIMDRYPTAPQRISNSEEVARIVSEGVGRMESGEFLTAMRVAEIPCSAVVTPEELIEDHELYALGILRNIPRDGIGMTIEPRPFGSDESLPWTSVGDAPTLGRDGRTR